MDKAHLLSILIVIQSLNTKNDHFLPKKEEEEMLDPKVLYLNVISVLLYSVQCTRPYIAFFMNLLARSSFKPTR